MSPTEKPEEMALKRYDVVLKHLLGDIQIYWTRSQFFLVTNAALLGFELNSFPSSEIGTSKLIALFLGGLVGMTLCILWIISVRSGRIWMDHWKRALSEWETLAFDNVNLYRQRPAGSPRSPKIPFVTAGLFLAVWSVFALYLLICICFRLRGCPLP